MLEEAGLTNVRALWPYTDDIAARTLLCRVRLREAGSGMKIGAIFPQLEIGDDPAVIRDYAQAVEGMGYDHILAYDHVLGAHPDRFEGRFRPPYTHQSTFHEPFVLFGYLAGLPVASSSSPASSFSRSARPRL